MKLDKRIKALTDIQSVTNGCHDWEFMTKKGYFAESITEFENLKKCVYAEYIGYREHERCFNYWDEKDGKDYTHYARYFIPEDSLLPEEKPEKKYRAFTLTEWINQHEIGNVIHYRSKSGEIELRQMYAGTRHSQGIKNIIVKITLGNESHTLDYLFENYEIEVNGEWQPFGIEVKDEE